MGLLPSPHTFSAPSDMVTGFETTNERHTSLTGNQLVSEVSVSNEYLF
jgi:hypothetical protein